MNPFILLFPATLTLQVPTSTPQKAVPLDGNWWLSKSKGYRLGFLWGFIDGSPRDVRKQRFSGRPPDSLHLAITKYLEEHSSDRQKPIAIALLTIEFMQPIKSAPGGETYSKRHGFLDGEYWRVSSKEEHYGLIEGYLAAANNFKTSKATFSHTIPFYEKQISSWYGTKEDNDDALNEKRASIPIADALFRLKD